ncbi:UNVERIFIED_CONTAM: Retrovirus-related Pol polyprotein from transposon TNT 1-94 [Sesamum latifolium]|uniref:Retrovirus-related Pol polyprotein from transposon TNT 1-94 n=1 Tax=Sesamum latifolium TaxID=2727402 RepID=A0AAW2U086_9LAMI
MQNSKRGFLPISHGKYLSKKQSPTTPDELDRMNKIPYASAIESIMYVMVCTRPDVSCALSMMSRFQSCPGNDHWTVVKNILKYLNRTKDYFLTYGGDYELCVKGYTDANFQTDKDDYRSQSDYVFIQNGGAISWKSSKQNTVAYSTTKAEYIVVAEAAKEAIWIKNFIFELGVVPSVASPIELIVTTMELSHKQKNLHLTKVQACEKKISLDSRYC